MGVEPFSYVKSFFCSYKFPELLVTRVKTLYRWFARDVTAAMLAVKNKSISLLWEINSIFMLILREKILLC